MTFTIADFKDLVDEFAECNESVHWYGEYSGRAGHKGVAIVTDCLSDAGEFVGDLKTKGYFFGKWDHSDNMGLDYIVSWSLNRFEEVKS
tara:strand:+ start:935 stop:1201 length:267 start_codon:yes stop_codon:yes gene_type:complete